MFPVASVLLRKTDQRTQVVAPLEGLALQVTLMPGDPWQTVCIAEFPS